MQGGEQEARFMLPSGVSSDASDDHRAVYASGCRAVLQQMLLVHTHRLTAAEALVQRLRSGSSGTPLGPTVGASGSRHPLVEGEVSSMQHRPDNYLAAQNEPAAAVP